MHFFYFYEGTSVTVEKARVQSICIQCPPAKVSPSFPGQVGPYIQVEKDKGIFHDKEPPAPVAAVAPAAPVVNGADNKEATAQPTVQKPHKVPVWHLRVVQAVEASQRHWWKLPRPKSKMFIDFVEAFFSSSSF